MRASHNRIVGGRYLLFLLMMTLLGVFPLDVILPSFPAIAQAFYVETTLVSYSVSMFAFGVAASQFFLGPLSDRLGRKRLLVTGLVVAMGGSVGCVLATSYTTFMVFRLIQALGCGCFVLSQALVEDVFRDQQRIYMRIVITSASGLFICLSPLAGSLLQLSLGWHGSFLIFTAIAAVVVVLAIVVIEERPVASNGESFFYSYVVLAKDAGFIKYSVIAALGFACHFAFVVVSPYLLIERLGLSTWDFSLAFIGYGLSFIAGGWLAKRLNRRFTAYTQMATGLCFIGIAGLLLAGWWMLAGLSVSGTLVSMMICTCGTTILRPAALTSALRRHPERAGAAVSLSNILLYMTGGGVSSMVATFEATLPFGLVLTLVATCISGGLLLRGLN